ncbi:uncharacterized protein BP5553_09939 [Venustampulla echinocandica]|uniref:peptidylprolyl isomerase n=1 Tax=Venustampulla echinocandica TaxID=2656787 RepID=A0A370TB34_9HELO|nr:uncharacterized protein BP5553_09939 [Venustampulla echinocandica]RDL31150.1 hypothetical protein BP5553_09939 [Venustampulla echinocandica]
MRFIAVSIAALASVATTVLAAEGEQVKIDVTHAVEWDDNLLDMCIGEKRTLTIPPEFGYGDRNMGPIPAGSTLIFETELMEIEGVAAPVSIEKSPSSVVDEATEGVKAAVKSKIAEAAEAAMTVLADTDGDEQEHNEL